ncbi:MAG TPA: hypothetical protein VHX11_10985 [Acidobacteriaceae bacterium]|nr:hypothetical protein [Acidobacteriaceae bacterium]
MSSNQTIPQEHAVEIRRLAHDLSNALEIVVQANYLLSTAALDDTAKQWLKLLDQGTRQAAEINRNLRDYVRSHSSS